MQDVRKLLTEPPDELRFPYKQRDTERTDRERDRDRLASRIAKAVRNVMLIDDPRTRKDIDTEITRMRDELTAIEAELAVEVPSTDRYNREDLLALRQWWGDFSAWAVSVAIKSKLPHWVAMSDQKPFADEQVVPIDKRIVNEALHELGCRVSIRWETRRAAKRNPYHFLRGRFQMGQKRGFIRCSSYADA